jgi:hypothetical protein
MTIQRLLALTGVLALSPLLAAGATDRTTRSSPRAVVFWEQGFPSVESDAVSADTLRVALADFDLSFVGVDGLGREGVGREVDLLVLPYGSAVPAEAWPAIRDHLRAGGNILTLGGRPFFAPVRRDNGTFVVGALTNAYARDVGLWHSYAAPEVGTTTRFAWDDDFAFSPGFAPRVRRVFVTAVGQGAGAFRGLAYLEGPQGARLAAPITRQDFIGGRDGMPPPGGARVVSLCFEPQPGYWASADGVALIRWSAAHAARGAVRLWLEPTHATLVPGEPPHVVVHVQRAPRTAAKAGPTTVRVELTDGRRSLAVRRVACDGSECRVPVAFAAALVPGLYTLRGTYEDAGGPAEGYLTGVWSRDARLLTQGARLEVAGETLRRDGAPYLPVGVNYFSSDIFPTGLFVGDNPCGNVYRWEQAFAEMERLGLTFVRTGTWMNQLEYLDTVTGGVEERFLRGLEAFLHSAARHRIQVQFTFWAFDPQTLRRSGELLPGPGANPYLDPVAREAQRRYLASIVGAFKDVPFLSWDLINEPNFANPRRLWSGNVPNGDAVELAAWRDWLSRRYGNAARLAEAWNTTPEALGGDKLDAVATPGAAALEPRREGSTEQMRAFDFNLFAQESFADWVRHMVGAVRQAGGQQLVVVGQDEGGVSNRLLSHFFADAGVGLTSNHTWWYDDALLWGSLTSKRPGLPAFIGETGVQPVWRVDGSWRYDERTTLGLIERKLALGFAAGHVGVLHWDWARDDVFGLLRGDGSRKIWMEALAGVARFASEAQPLTDRPVRGEVALVLPQSLQLSVLNRYAQEAQQRSVRALYHGARSSAYAVGEYQLGLLGQPKLILLPSPFVLSEAAWQALLEKVRAGAVLAATGTLGLDEHFRAVDRLGPLGIPSRTTFLASRETRVAWDGVDTRLSFPGDKVQFLERAELDGERALVRQPLGRGQILYCPWPLELNENTEAVASFYRLALTAAGQRPEYTTDEDDPGILIAPTRFERATLYVLSSESAEARTVSFGDGPSATRWRVSLAPGRAALGLIATDGRLVAHYGEWRRE